MARRINHENVNRICQLSSRRSSVPSIDRTKAYEAAMEWYQTLSTTAQKEARKLLKGSGFRLSA